jgi:tetratricopeptide (TPR) repeat protein
MTARKMCDAPQHFAQALEVIKQTETLTENEENIFVHELSLCYRIEHIVVQIQGIEIRRETDEVVDRVLHRCGMDDKSVSVVSQLDEDVRICYAVLHLDSQRQIAHFLGPCKQKYPKSIYFLELSAMVNVCLGQCKTALYDTNTRLELDPNYHELLYYKAVALRLIGRDMSETITAYRPFLAAAPKDHRKAPESYYAMASCYFEHKKHEGTTDNIKKTYEQGVEAKKLQLPCFLPDESNIKTLIKDMLDVKSLLSPEPSTPVISNKLRLINPHRIEVILEQREWQSRLLKERDNPDHTVIPTTYKP